MAGPWPRAPTPGPPSSIRPLYVTRAAQDSRCVDSRQTKHDVVKRKWPTKLNPLSRHCCHLQIGLADISLSNCSAAITDKCSYLRATALQSARCLSYQVKRWIFCAVFSLLVIVTTRYIFPSYFVVFVIAVLPDETTLKISGSAIYHSESLPL